MIKFSLSEISPQKVVEDKEYIEFINVKEHLFIFMEKVTDDICIDITDKELESRIIEKNTVKMDSIV